MKSSQQQVQDQMQTDGAVIEFTRKMKAIEGMQPQINDMESRLGCQSMNAEITLKQKVEDAGDITVCAKSVAADPTACDSAKGGVTKQSAYSEPCR